MSGLAHQIVEAPDGPAPGATLYVLHGFLGSGRNWSSFARRLVELRPGWRAVLVDLRLHGDSQDIPGPHSVAAAADDLVALDAAIGRPGEPVAVLGHSLGGKIALAATGRLSPAPRQTWVIDSTPSPAGAGGASSKMLARLETSPASFADRDAAVDWILGAGFDEGTARWMATSLVGRDGAWAWGLDTDGLGELLSDFGTADLWSVLESPPAGAEIHLVRAARGSLVADEDASRVGELAGRGESVALHELDGGHWLHIDNPDDLLELLASSLPRF